jgi:hypothetical protein
LSGLEIILSAIAGLAGGASIGAALAAGVRYGRRGREQVAKHLAERRSSAVEQLRQWEYQGILVIDDEALEAAIYWEKADPNKLEKLVHLIRTVIEKEGAGAGNGGTLILGVSREAPEVDTPRQESQAPPPSLQVTAGFS